MATFCGTENGYSCLFLTGIQLELLKGLQDSVPLKHLYIFVQFEWITECNKPSMARRAGDKLITAI